MSTLFKSSCPKVSNERVHSKFSKHTSCVDGRATPLLLVVSLVASTLSGDFSLMRKSWKGKAKAEIGLREGLVMEMLDCTGLPDGVVDSSGMRLIRKNVLDDWPGFSVNTSCGISIYYQSLFDWLYYCEDAFCSK